MRIFIGGVTGIGKSFLVRKLAIRLKGGYIAKSASEIIKETINSNDKYEILKLNEELAEEKRKVALINFIKKQQRIIVDGHFTVRWKDQLKIVYHDEFSEIFDLFIILTDTIENIAQRRGRRKGKLDSLDRNKIKHELRFEIETAKNFLSKKGKNPFIIAYDENIEVILSKILSLIQDKESTTYISNFFKLI